MNSSSHWLCNFRIIQQCKVYLSSAVVTSFENIKFNGVIKDMIVIDSLCVSWFLLPLVEWYPRYS
jgi:hypothetical protein